MCRAAPSERSRIYCQPNHYHVSCGVQTGTASSIATEASTGAPSMHRTQQGSLWHRAKRPLLFRNLRRATTSEQPWLPSVPTSYHVPRTVQLATATLAPAACTRSTATAATESVDPTITIIAS